MLYIKKYILVEKLTVYYKVSFTCNMYFLNSTYFILLTLRVTNFRASFAVEYSLTTASHIYFSVDLRWFGNRSCLLSQRVFRTRWTGTVKQTNKQEII